MSRIDVLRDEYPGDEAWKRFADVFRAATISETAKKNVAAALGDSEIALVLSALLGERAFAWCNSQIPGIDNRTPSDVISDLEGGVRVIRNLVMRMPM